MKSLWLNLIRRKQQFSTFRAYVKKHDSEANLFIENQCLKWSSFEEKIRLWSKPYPGKWDFELKAIHQVRFWIEHFSSRKISKTKIFEWTYSREKLFSKKNQVLNSIFEKQDFGEKITSTKSFWLNLLSRKQQTFHFACLFWKAWFWSKPFHWKSDFETGISEKKFEFWSEVFSYNLISFWIESFSSWRISLTNLTFCAYLKRHDFDASFFIENQSSKWTFFENNNQIMKRNIS